VAVEVVATVVVEAVGARAVVVEAEAGARMAVVVAVQATGAAAVVAHTAVEVPARTAGTKSFLLTQRPARTIRTGLLFFGVNSEWNSPSLASHTFPTVGSVTPTQLFQPAGVK